MPRRSPRSYFPLLGLTPRAGRLFDERDDGDRDRLAVLTTPYWITRHGADMSVVGRTITINGTPHTIAGVLPANAGPVARDMSVFVLERWAQPQRTAGFAATALLIALVGIYGAMSHFVRQHTHELGIRLALGGQPSDVRRLVIGQGIRVAGAGVVIGLAAGVILTRLLTSQLFGVTRTDQASGLVSVAVLLLAFTVITCGIPGRRASRLNPVSLLRE